MPVPTKGWNDIYKVCERHLKDHKTDLRPTIYAGIIWQAVMHAIDRVDLLITEAQETHRPVPTHEIQRRDMLRANEGPLETHFNSLPAALELEDLIIEALDFIQEHQLRVLRTQLNLDVLKHIYDPLLALGVDRTTLTLLGLNVDQRSGTQSTNRLPEHEVFRQIREGHGQGGAGGGSTPMREMGRRGMPLGRMSYRQRLQYAGGY
ncbi:hypothetical protein JCM6882_001305 [Rhodosporidiobolus microsporus]